MIQRGGTTEFAAFAKFAVFAGKYRGISQGRIPLLGVFQALV